MNSVHRTMHNYGKEWGALLETEYNIDGGITWLSDGPINIVWYPSAKMHSEMGVIISAYGMQRITAFNELPNMEATIAASRRAVERLHPAHSKDLHSPMFVVWGKIPCNQRAWIQD